MSNSVIQNHLSLIASMIQPPINLSNKIQTKFLLGKEYFYIKKVDMKLNDKL